MYIGPFYFDTKEIFLILAVTLLCIITFLQVPIWWFDAKSLLTLAIIVLITKGLLPAIHNEAFFMLVIVAIFLTLYFPIFSVLLFYFVSFALFRLLKVI